MGLSITVSSFNMYMSKQRLIQSLIDLKTVNATLTIYIYIYMDIYVNHFMSFCSDLKILTIYIYDKINYGQ